MTDKKMEAHEVLLSDVAIATADTIVIRLPDRDQCPGFLLVHGGVARAAYVAFDNVKKETHMYSCPLPESMGTGR